MVRERKKTKPEVQLPPVVMIQHPRLLTRLAKISPDPLDHDIGIYMLAGQGPPNQEPQLASNRQWQSQQPLDCVCLFTAREGHSDARKANCACMSLAIFIVREKALHGRKDCFSFRRHRHRAASLSRGAPRSHFRIVDRASQALLFSSALSAFPDQFKHACGLEPKIRIIEVGGHCGDNLITPDVDKGSSV